MILLINYILNNKITLNYKSMYFFKHLHILRSTALQQQTLRTNKRDIRQTFQTVWKSHADFLSYSDTAVIWGGRRRMASSEMQETDNELILTAGNKNKCPSLRCLM